MNWTQESWHENNPVGAFHPEGFAYGNGKFVVVGAGIATSPDGATWTVRTTPPISGWLTAVIFQNGKFYAVGTGGDDADIS